MKIRVCALKSRRKKIQTIKYMYLKFIVLLSKNNNKNWNTFSENVALKFFYTFCFKL